MYTVSNITAAPLFCICHIFTMEMLKSAGRFFWIFYCCVVPCLCVYGMIGDKLKPLPNENEMEI